jgi:hypothetical protein
VVRLGLLAAVRWLGRRSRTRDGERTVVGFWPKMENTQWSGGPVSGRQWRAHGGVEERRRDGERERERERERGRENFGREMVWERNEYRMGLIRFQNSIFDFF